MSSTGDVYKRQDIHYRRGREGGYYEEKSASDKTEADNTIIHQPDGETGEKSENVQEQIGKESEAPAKISAPIPSQTGEKMCIRDSLTM